MLRGLADRPVAWLAVLAATAGLATVWASLRARRDLQAFLGSCAFLAGMVLATAACLFPVMLRAIDDSSRSLTAYNSAVPASSLRIALGWWAMGFPLAVVYLVTLFRLHRGKATGASGRQGY
jgi:cytochrome d ubiquinol oxidase subunit II